MDKEELRKLVKELEELQIRQEAVIKKIRRVSTEGAPQYTRADQSATPQKTDPFLVGSKVLIKNKLGHVHTGRPSIKDRVGTIIKTTKKRVHIKMTMR